MFSIHFDEQNRPKMIPGLEERKSTTVMHLKSRQTGHGQAKVNGTRWSLRFLHTHTHTNTVNNIVTPPLFHISPKIADPLVPVSKKKNFLPRGLI